MPGTIDRARFHQWLHGRWRVPAVSGVLILASFVVARFPGVDSAAEVLMTSAAVVAGAPIVVKAARGLAVRVVGIDLLVSVATIGALVIGQYWEAAAVTFLFAVGHALENATLNKTRSALAELIAVAPDVAIVLRDGHQVEIPAASVLLGETVLVKNGAKVPVDGAVTGGTGALDEASITGESIPVEKLAGDRVFAGTISRGGFLQVEATGVGADTTLARIIHRVEEAQDAKAATQAIMDRFSAWYTPAIIVLALVVGLVTGDVVLALTLLVIGCPGALVISIPVAVVAGIGRGARDGILIKGGEFLETSARITAVALDKTGTLTKGRPVLTDVVVLDPTLTRGDVLMWAARAEAGSEHPLARPIVQAARAEGLPVAGVPDATEPVPGKGIVAVVDGHRIVVGNLTLLTAEGITDTTAPAGTVERLAATGRTPMVVAIDGRVAGVVAVADSIRPDAAAMVANLHAAGVRRVVMLTGDTAAIAGAVGAQVGVDEVRAGLLPEDKLDAVRELQAQGHTVAMVGDGVNDAPALATADIGVAMGAAGSGVAIETADIALMGDDLLKLPQAIALARRTVRTMRQNIVVALVTVGLLLAGVLGGGVTMSAGMLVHEVSVLVVIINAMRLLRRRQVRAATDAQVSAVPAADVRPRRRAGRRGGDPRPGALGGVDDAVLQPTHVTLEHGPGQGAVRPVGVVPELSEELVHPVPGLLAEDVGEPDGGAAVGRVLRSQGLGTRADR
nr:cation-translocating P-type ATPase [Cellulomonas sp. KRMCY2]